MTPHPVSPQGRSRQPHSRELPPTISFQRAVALHRLSRQHLQVRSLALGAMERDCNCRKHGSICKHS